MTLNVLDGMISPVSNITFARFGILWAVDIDLDTEGKQDFLNFPTISVIFEIRSDLDVKLYTIQFINGVVIQEFDNVNGFETDPENFKMKGVYTSETKIFSFGAHPDAVIADGAKFWIYAQFGQTGGGPNFNTSSNSIKGTQFPFQYGLTGAINGIEKTVHLITAPKRITIQTPYIEQEDTVFEHFIVATGWVSGKEPLLVTGNEAVTKTRGTRNIRASQPFHLKAIWGRKGGVAIDITLTRVNFGWGINAFQINIEHPTCGDANVVAVPPDDTGTVVHAISGSDAGDNETILMPSTSASLTVHQNQVSADGDGFGTGTINCEFLGVVAFTRYVMSSIEFVSTYGFNKWQEI